MGKKLDNLVLVTFKKNYSIGKSSKVLYAAGTHAMHKNIAKKIEDVAEKGEVSVKKYDKKEHLEKIKTANAKKESK